MVKICLRKFTVIYCRISILNRTRFLVSGQKIFLKTKLFSAFANINHITISIKLRNFQYKLLHRVLALNPFLNKIGIVGDNKCTFCKLLNPFGMNKF